MNEDDCGGDRRRDRREIMERMEQPPDNQPAKLRDNRTNRLGGVVL